jgi:hypothetical protein
MVRSAPLKAIWFPILVWATSQPCAGAVELSYTSDSSATILLAVETRTITLATRCPSPNRITIDNSNLLISASVLGQEKPGAERDRSLSLHRVPFFQLTATRGSIHTPRAETILPDGRPAGQAFFGRFSALIMPTHLVRSFRAERSKAQRRGVESRNRLE